MPTVDIPIKDPKNPPALKLPEKCVHCGKPREATMTMSIHMGVEKRSRQVVMEIPVPMCTEGERLERGVAKVTLVPFLVGGLLIGAAAFVPAWLIAPQGTTPQTLNFDLVFGGFVGLIAGIMGGTLVEFVFRLLFTPVYGRLLVDRPLTVMDIFSDSENFVGLSAKLSKDKKQLQLKFERDDVAREFVQMNLREKS